VVPAAPPVVDQTQTTVTQVRRGSGPLPWILGGVAALVLVGLLAMFMSQNNGAAGTATFTPTATATVTTTPTTGPSATPLAVVVTATPGPATETPSVTPTETATLPPTPSDTPVPGLPTVTPGPSATPVPPSATPVPPTNTPLPPKPTATSAPAASPTPEAQPSAAATVSSGDETPIVIPTFILATPTIVPAGPTDTPPAGPVGGPPPDVGIAAPQEGYVTVQWFGQACFMIAGGEGVRVLIDPVGPQVGYNLPMFNGLDALLISHLHQDHTYTQVVAGGTPKYVGLTDAGKFNPIQAQVKSIAIRDVESTHDNNGGASRGTNAIWVIDVDGFHVVHLGDLGQLELSDKQIQAIGQPDILMIPVGDGGFTIDGLQARRIVQQLNPHLVIPMHYRTDRTPATSPLKGVADFLGGPPPTNAPNVVRLKRADINGKTPRVLVMNYK
jgi:L-ascorbate metabolism protein UlaG (beta-lactamase superfamily)